MKQEHKKQESEKQESKKPDPVKQDGERDLQLHVDSTSKDDTGRRRPEPQD